MNTDLLDEELLNLADEERAIQEMDYSKLSNPDAVICWFRDPCYDLCELGDSEAERFYLNIIDEVFRRTGAPNLFMADYIWRLESRISRVEKTMESINGNSI